MKTLKVGVCLMAAVLLSGCNPLMSASLNNLKSAVIGPDELDVSAEQVAGVKYPQLKLTTPSGSGVLALVREREDLQFWVASGKQVLLMRDGLAMRTVGLGVEGDLDGTRLSDDSPFKQGLHRITDGYTSRRWIDLYKGQEVGSSSTAASPENPWKPSTFSTRNTPCCASMSRLTRRPSACARPTVTGSIRWTVSLCKVNSN